MGFLSIRTQRFIFQRINDEVEETGDGYRDSDQNPNEDSFSENN
jgi:hypothetical protein